MPAYKSAKRVVSKYTPLEIRPRSAPAAAVVIQNAFRKRKLRKFGQSGAEIKFLDNAFGTTSSSTAVVNDIGAMAQGLTNLTRIGNKVQIKGIQWTVRYRCDVGNAIVLPNNVRWSVVLDKEPEVAAVASYNQIYTGNTPYGFRNVGDYDRFVVLATGRMTLGGVDPGASLVSITMPADGCMKIEDGYKRVDIAEKFAGTTAAQASIASNQILFCYVMEFTDADSTFTIATRVTYTDE